MKKFLFVAGVPRSGTSALTEMLNGHSDIAIGMERYRSLVSTGALFKIGAKLFDRSRFFDWSPEDTNVRIEGGKYDLMYESLRAKYEAVIYHGDKGPGYFSRAHRFLSTFPGAKMVIIWRCLEDVAMSWQRRSIDRSGWPAENDAMAALEKSRSMMRRIVNVKTRFPESIELVRYEQVFSPGDATPFEIVDWLGLDPADPSFKETIDSLRQKALKLNAQREPVLPDVRSALAHNTELHELTSKLDRLTRQYA